ncbi:uncharacterized protein LOC143296340 [Babylonia areolata]|uniref:uncharacterized protein LOC143296340 n=1 Tax=Babylonia areolata TaxID=304850 RepID=UPI003FD1D466
MSDQHREGQHPAEGFRRGARKRGFPGNSRTEGGEVKVKREATGEEEGGPMSSQSRERLRTAIFERREAQGLGRMEVRFQQPVKHELTPRELEKAERRREQNRRAARKCREKKREAQSSVAQNCSRLVADNRAINHEVNVLRSELCRLHGLLQDHNRSGQCCQLPLPALPAPPAILTSPDTSPLPGDQSSPPPSVERCAQPVVDMNTYLHGLGPLQPDATFTDLDTFMNLDRFDLDTIPSPDLIPVDLGLPAPQPSPPPSSPPFEPVESLRMLEPPVPRACHGQSMLLPTSPVSGYGRLSVSSVSSAVSEQPWGFCAPASSGLGSPLSSDMEEGAVVSSQGFQTFHPTSEDDDDDVFSFDDQS